MFSLLRYIILVFVLTACATPHAPEGGPRDTKPPKVTLSQPAQLSKNFDSKNIVITFDEWIQIQNLKKHLIISPPITPEPDIIAKKNELKINFKDSLQDSTTYSIFFGDAVKDNNEGNVINNLSYVFSTGDEIDSLYISGQIHTLDGSKVPANTFVQLYTSLEDSIISQERPKYIYKVDESGSFKIDYLPVDTFQLFVLNDMNTNYQYDLATEWIGKFDSIIILNKSKENLQIPIFLPEDDEYKIKNYNSTLKDNILSIELSKSLNPRKDTILLQNLNLDTIAQIHDSYTTKHFHYYILSDSSSFQSILSINGITIDTLRLKQPSKEPESSVLLPMSQKDFKYSILRAYDNEHFYLKSSAPIEKVEKSKIWLLSENDTLPIQGISIDSNMTEIIVSHSLDETFDGYLFFEDSSVIFKNGSYLDSTQFKIQYTDSNDFGEMTFEIHLPSLDTQYVVRILDEQNIPHFETISLGDTILNYSFPKLLGGEYFVEVVEDINQSGTWNGASFWNYKLAERVYQSQKYAPRANWEDVHPIYVDFKQTTAYTPSPNLLEIIIEQAQSQSKSQDKPASKPSIQKEDLDLVKPGNLPDFKKR